MNERRRIFFLILIMNFAVLVVWGVSIYILYQAALEESKERLRVTAQSQARLIEAVARFDQTYAQDHPGGPAEGTLSQVRDSHEQYEGFGETGEFTLARLEGELIVFLLNHRHFDFDVPAPVPIASAYAEPMRQALLGNSGSMIGLDYRGERVVAAFEPVQELDWGIVAKIDLAEVRAPFITASAYAGLIAILIDLSGIIIFLRVSNPILKYIEESEWQFRQIASQMSGAIYRFRADPGGDFSMDFLSEGAQDLFDKPLSQLMGPSDLFADLHPDDYEPFMASLQKSMENLTPWNHEFRVIWERDQSLHWIRGRSNPRKEADGSILWHGVLSDITERKHAEQALQEAHNTLEQRVEERTRELQKLVNAMAGREVRMAELKQVIQKLRRQLMDAGQHPTADDPLNEMPP